LVDELDDPSPGHLSDHVTPLSSTTTASGPSGLPFMGSLEDRFVKAKDEHVGETSVGSSNGGAEDMVLDDDADCDKENKA
jgi:serine/threonine-protein phosphatase 4 regulatory subunit 2